MTTIVAQLRYRGSLIDVELIEGEVPRSFVIRCPACQTRSRLNEGKHCVTWEMQAGLISVDKPITCPRPECGWHVRIDRNITRDVEEILVDRGMDPRSGAHLPGSRESQIHRGPKRKANGSG